MPGPRGSPGNDGCTSCCASWASTRSSRKAASSWTARASRSATGPGTCPCTCSAGPPTWITRPRTSRHARRSRWCRSCSTGTTPSCGRSSPTAQCCGCCATPPTLVGSSYVEFDLAAIFDGELFSDFVLLYLICHESRFATHEDGGPASCYLEQWRGFAAEQGERALDQLRDGVKEAISILGTGFLSHPDNPQLRARLDPRNADLRLDDFNRALLRLVYRLLFWFVAEDRGALLKPDPEDAGSEAAARLRQARDRYATYFSSARLRQLARRHRGGRHGDLFEAAELVFDALGIEGGVPELALAGIGGIFESKGDDGGLSHSTSHSPVPGCPTKRCSAQYAPCRW